MSATAGWYPDPGGGQDLYRYWDGKSWSAATSTNPSAPPPAQGLAGPPAPPTPAGYGQAAGGQPYGQQAAGSNQAGFGQTGFGQGGSQPMGAYGAYQQQTKKKSPVGWWIGAGVLALVIALVIFFVVRTVNSGSITGTPGGPGSGSVCPNQPSASPSPAGPKPNDGRVHGGPVSYPKLATPWSDPTPENRVPFGRDVLSQVVTVEPNYDDDGSSWVASVTVGELQAGDGFFTPEQGAQIVVKCILGAFYGKNAVNSNVTVNKATTIDSHEAWLVESKLTFDIPNLTTKGELLIVAIVATGSTAGLYYASIPDTRPELVAPARTALKGLSVDS